MYDSELIVRNRYSTVRNSIHIYIQFLDCHKLGKTAAYIEAERIRFLSIP